MPTCTGGRARAAAASTGKRPPRRALWGRDDHGRFRTRGSNSVATVRGTAWYVEDRCDGTLTRVSKGSVSVRDLHRQRTVVVKAGKSYLAPSAR
jgi:ferric-dicitrate binding protein FerR (iron transport regulator)